MSIIMSGDGFYKRMEYEKSINRMIQAGTVCIYADFFRADVQNLRVSGEIPALQPGNSGGLYIWK